jgi:hypothetical protein
VRKYRQLILVEKGEIVGIGDKIPEGEYGIL